VRVGEREGNNDYYFRILSFATIISLDICMIFVFGIFRFAVFFGIFTANRFGLTSSLGSLFLGLGFNQENRKGKRKITPERLMQSVFCLGDRVRPVSDFWSRTFYFLNEFF